MKIGIDIDDTTFCTVKSMLKYADIFEEEISGVPINRDSFGLIILSNMFSPQSIKNKHLFSLKYAEVFPCN